MLFIYNLFLSLYVLGIRAYSLFNEKAKKWVAGRKDWQQRIRTTLPHGERRIWIHCSSVGEFEQARPVIEALKAQYPAYKIVVTFFSPSGYEACSRNSLIDFAFYLPVDSRQNAARFIELVAPKVAIFVKYEFWYHYLQALKKQSIPALLVSGAFRREQVFFKSYGSLFRKMLSCFSFFYVQDETSRQLLSSIGFNKNIIISGDTRYDRVSFIAKNVSPIPAIERFIDSQKIFIAGSTWPGDEDVIKDSLSVLPPDWKLIIAPHEVDAAHISKVKELFGQEAILYSQLDAEYSGGDKRILIIDNIGMLSRLFAYGNIAFIGGGFQKGGIHNVLEPAVFGLPVIIGPVYEKFVEAKELVSREYIFPVNNVAECGEILKKLVTDIQYRETISNSLKQFMQEYIGATGKIIDNITANKWLV